VEAIQMNKNIGMSWVLAACLLLAGCLSKPAVSSPGKIILSYTLPSTLTPDTTIRLIRATIAKGELSRTVATEETNTTAPIIFENVPAGKWKVTVRALDTQDQEILAGESTVNVKPDQPVEVTVALAPPPPPPTVFEVIFDATAIPEVGSVYQKGKIGLSKTPSGSSPSYYDLKLDGTILRREFTDREPGSYQCGIYIPQKTKAFYATPLVSVEIAAAKTTRIRINPDGKVTPFTDETIFAPAPTGLSGIYNGQQVTLCWPPDTTGQRQAVLVYGTDASGLFRLLATLDGSAKEYSIPVDPLAAKDSRILYSVSFVDAAGWESFWSPSYVLANP
jgi:hypothetical protein